MSAPDPADTLRTAIQLHQSGRLAEAEALYRELLATYPRQPDVLRFLGVLAHQQGLDGQAVVLLREAIRSAPRHAPAHADLGDALLGLGQTEAALASYRHAIDLNPAFVEAHNNLGNALRAAGDPAAALASFNRALELRPDFPEAHNNIGLTLSELSQTDAALRHLRQALALRPDFPQAHNNLGLLLEALGRPDEAVASLERAVALNPAYAEAHNNLGNALHAAGRFEDALEAYARALGLRPDYAEAHNNRGQLLEALGRVDEGLECYRQAIRWRPGFAEAHWNEALALLRQGDFAAGWRQYEWRWKAVGRRQLVREFREPLWLGDTPLAGQTLFVHYEQGLGDTLQMLRYMPVLAALGARVVLEVPPPLAAIAGTVPGNPAVVVEGAPLPSFDLQCPLMSLPLACRTTLEKVPDTVPYLGAPEPVRSEWRNRLGPATRRRIGLAWSGSAGHTSAMRQRRLPFDKLDPLFSLDAEFHSLQKEYLDEERDRLLADGRIREHSAVLEDFAATAGLIDQLDLVITVDTAVAHLAGAMGKPVWVMLPFAADYRWMTKRTDSPWYPTMRLFRQPAHGDWDTVIGQIIATINDQSPPRPAAP